jgi:S-DNA-T family DNA segregation ATPase FtsK/SpoIIIE
MLRAQQLADEESAVEHATNDDIYDAAVELVRERQRASTSILQRHFRIGYARAARLIDRMEDENIIGPAIGSEPRKVN